MRLGSSIQKHAESRGTAPVGGVGAKPPTMFFSQIGKMFFDKTNQNFKSGHIHMKDAECAETNEKSISRILFIVIWSISY